jgi:hypothetical protein
MHSVKSDSSRLVDDDPGARGGAGAGSPIGGGSHGTARTWLLSILFAAVLARAYAVPDRYYFNDTDEAAYLMGGTNVLEGLPPLYHYAFAGPETWVGLVYAAGLSARYYFLPTTEELQVPRAVRPFVAVNHAIFDIYRDLSGLRLTYVVLSMLLSLAAVAAGFKYGQRRGGVAGAVLVGGLVALLPVLVAHSAAAKPYSAAWSCVIIAAYLAAESGERSRWWAASAIFLGLAVSSRVEMLGVVPVFILCEIWPRRASMRDFGARTIKYVAILMATLMVVAPWSLTNLMGNLRAIATIRLGPPPGRPPGVGQLLWDVGWVNALGLPIVLLLAAWVLALVHRRRLAAGQWPWLGTAYCVVVLSSIAAQTGYGMRHQGPAFMSLLLILPYAAGLVATKVGFKPTIMVASAALLLAGVETAAAAHAYHASYIPDSATQWVNTHVPPGTIVYLSPTFYDPLPTPEAADAIWDEVSGRQATVRKFNKALLRLNLGRALSPRALSEQIVTTERGLARRFYILGSRAEQVGPRFDLRRYYSSDVFGLRDPVPDYLRTGGVLIWRGDGPPPGLGAAPAMRWTNSAGRGTYIFISPELAEEPLGTGK